MKTHKTDRVTYIATLMQDACLWDGTATYDQMYDMCDNLGGISFAQVLESDTLNLE